MIGLDRTGQTGPAVSGSPQTGLQQLQMTPGLQSAIRRRLRIQPPVGIPGPPTGGTVPKFYREMRKEG